MNTYSKESHPNLYEEILKDYQFRFPKFHPIPYPTHRNLNHDSINQEQKTDSK